MKEHLFKIRVERVINNVELDSIANKLMIDIPILFEKWSKISDIKIRTCELFTLETDHSHDELIKNEILNHPFAEVTFERSYIPEGDQHWFCLEKWYKPGVTDNIGNAFSESLKLTIGKTIHVHSGFRIWLGFNLNHNFVTLKQNIKEYSDKVFFNSLIENCSIYTKQEAITIDYELFNKPKLYTISESGIQKVVTYDFINKSLEDLLKLSNAQFWAFSIEEILVIKNYYISIQRNPTDVEVEIIAQTWSEHCKHKIFNANIEIDNKRKDIELPKFIESIFKTYIKGSTYHIQNKWENTNKKNILQSVFEDNAGIVQITNEVSCAIKVETHNTPSALDPYGGALTGIVGVNRDILGAGLGAEPIANLDVFCVGNTSSSNEDVPEGLHHPKRILEGIRLGIEHGGNKSGIPTITGAVVENDCYIGKPLVFCGTIGLMPNPNPYVDKVIHHGDLIVMTGGRIGADGIHGATFSSIELNENSPVSAVQLGDPLTQKRVWDFMIEARNLKLFNAVTDNGAGGLSSSIGELARLCGKSGGANLDIGLAKTKYPGLKPFELVISESQERMSFAVSKDKMNDFLNLSLKRGVESTVLGEFVDSGKFHILYKNETVGNIDMKFLHEATPKLTLHAIVEDSKINLTNNTQFKVQNIKVKLKETLSSPNVRSQKRITQQYDHEVQARTVQKPYGSPNHLSPTDGGCLRLSRTSYEGVAIGVGLAPHIAKYDMKSSAEYAFDEALRNSICSGIDLNHAVSVDNFCWPDPLPSPSNTDAEQKCGDLVLTALVISEMASVFEIPFVSGKDSMKNDYRKGDLKISIIPTVLITIMGKVRDVRFIPKGYAKKSSQKQKIYWISGQEHLSGVLQYTKSGYSKVNYKNLKNYYNTIHKAIQQQTITSIHDVSDGGWLTTTAEMLFGTGLGAKLNFKNEIENIFGDFAAGFVVILDEENENKFLMLFKDYFLIKIGELIDEPILYFNNEKIDISELERAYEN